jgi:hypothetical protein
MTVPDRWQATYNTTRSKTVKAVIEDLSAVEQSNARLREALEAIVNSGLKTTFPGFERAMANGRAALAGESQ